MHNREKAMDTLMGRHDLPSEIKAQEMGKLKTDTSYSGID